MSVTDVQYVVLGAGQSSFPRRLDLQLSRSSLYGGEHYVDVGVRLVRRITTLERLVLTNDNHNCERR